MPYRHLLYFTTTSFLAGLTALTESCMPGLKQVFKFTKTGRFVSWTFCNLKFGNWTFCILDGSVTGRLVIGRLVTGRFVTGRYVTVRFMGVPFCTRSYLGKMVGSTGQPLSSMMGKVERESLAMATQFLQQLLDIRPKTTSVKNCPAMRFSR
jgi:hypothetical protein